MQANRALLVTVIFLVITFNCDCLNDTDGQLLSVVVVFRHGDRTPIDPYPNDPYRNASYWPVGWGQLTNIGKEQHYQLGRWFRSRYSDFLPDSYSETDIRIVSTDVDRTLMSAEANLAGLYPPAGGQIWDQNIKWQPIPIHTLPEVEDAVLAMKKKCPKYDLLLRQLKKSQAFKDIDHKLHDLYAYLTKNTGTLVASVQDLEYVYNNLFIEDLYNFTLPNWTKPIYPDKLKPWADFAFAINTYTKELARLKTGPFFHQLQELFSNTSAQESRFHMFSAHDLTIASLLNSLGIFQYHSPPYTSTIIFELRSSKDGPFVNILYKNSSEPQKMVLSNCDFNCPLLKFVDLLEPISVALPQWSDECRVGILTMAAIDDLKTVYVFTTIACVSLLSLIVAIFVVHRRRRRKNIYFRLPDDCADA